MSVMVSHAGEAHLSPFPVGSITALERAMELVAGKVAGHGGGERHRAGAGRAVGPGRFERGVGRCRKRLWKAPVPQSAVSGSKPLRYRPTSVTRPLFKP